MTKEELTKKMAESAGTTAAAAERAFNALVANITEALKRGERVAIVGFGAFSVRASAARTGRNPKTGEAIKIPAKKRAVFKAGKELKEALK